MQISLMMMFINSEATLLVQVNCYSHVLALISNVNMKVIRSNTNFFN